MQGLFVSGNKGFEMMYNAIVMAVTVMPSDTKDAILKHLYHEKNDIARMHLEATIRNCELAERDDRLICADTGYPLFYIKAGDNVKIDGGFSTLYQVSKEAIKKATANAKLRPNMVHPISRKNTGTNVGYYLPKVEIRFDPTIDYLDIIAVPKGGDLSFLEHSIK